MRIYLSQSRILMAILTLFVVNQQQGTLCNAGPLEVPVTYFSATNASLSGAINSLAKHCPVPINSVIEGVSEPDITLTLTNGTVGDVLKSILKTAPEYAIAETNGAILITPLRFSGDNQHPLNLIIDQLEVKYDSWETSRKERAFSCTFSRSIDTGNVMLPYFATKRESKVREFPTNRLFKQQRLFDILCRISRDMNESWCFYQLKSEYAEALNLLSDKSPNGWLFNTSLPAYIVSWGKEAVHDQPSLTQNRANPNANKEHTELLRDYWKPRYGTLAHVTNTQELSGVSIDCVVQETHTNSQPVILTLQLKNASDKRITLLNPFLDDPQRAFWSISRSVQTEAGHGAYIVIFPKAATAGEPLEITLEPHKAYEKQVSLLGATMILDPVNSDFPMEKRSLVEKLGAAGKYFLMITAYSKTNDGLEHYLPPIPIQFQIVPKADKPVVPMNSR